jgi:acetyl-CoA carboxylase biotin carboxyl carrier protein
MKQDEVRLTYDLTYKDVVDILKIIDDSTCLELHLELGDLKLNVIKGRDAEPMAPSRPDAAQAASRAPVPAPEKTAATAPPVPGPAAEAVAGKAVPVGKSAEEAALAGIKVRSPLAGTFYRSPSPGAPPFVEKGSVVKAGDQLAIVEVMKLMNSIRAPQDGVITEILVPNETMVAMGQVIMLMAPPAGKGAARKTAAKRK